MSRVVGDIAVTVGADVSGLERGMKRAGRSVKGFENNASQLAARMAKVTVAVGAVGVAVAAAGVKIASSAANVAKNIENQSRLVGVSAEKFQKLAVAGETIGFSQEKMADIFKDVNDKFGDFMATGAGPLRDFFENIAPQVGVTADQFARLSGPEALQLYVSSLERAGVSQQQMTFYMEALASDATGLIPLLANNGSEMRRLGDEAARSGRILSNDAVRGGAELDRELTDLANTLKITATSAVLEFSDELVAMAEWVTETAIPAIKGLVEWFGTVAGAISGAAGELEGFIDKVNAIADSNGLTAGAIFGDENGQLPDWLRTLRGEVPGNGAPQLSTALLRSSESGTNRTMPDSVFGVEPMVTPLEELWKRLEQEQEVKAEFDEKDRARGAAHAARMEQIEERSWDKRMSNMSGVLGNMSSLMSTENEKLFRIGQAAALAEAIVNGYSAATSAWAKGMAAGGPPLAAAFLAGSVAKTGALIAGIASQSPRGSAGGGTAAGGFAAAQAPQQQPVERQVAEFRFMGGNVLDPRAIVNAMNEAANQGYVIRGVLA